MLTWGVFTMTMVAKTAEGPPKIPAPAPFPEHGCQGRGGGGGREAAAS